MLCAVREKSHFDKLSRSLITLFLSERDMKGRTHVTSATGWNITEVGGAPQHTSKQSDRERERVCVSSGYIVVGPSLPQFPSGTSLLPWRQQSHVH